MSMYGWARPSSAASIWRNFQTPSSNAQRNIAAASSRTALVSAPSSTALIIRSSKDCGRYSDHNPSTTVGRMGDRARLGRAEVGRQRELDGVGDEVGQFVGAALVDALGDEKDDAAGERALERLRQ